MGGGLYREQVHRSAACCRQAHDSVRVPPPAGAATAAGYRPRRMTHHRQEQKPQPKSWSTTRKILTFLLLLSSGVTTAGAGELTILDTLGDAAPTTRFSIFGSWGTAIYGRSYVGVRFTLTQPTVLTEIGGFINNCHTISGGLPHCPNTQPLTVQIHPATSSGTFDPSTTLATFLLSHDNDPLVVSYESVATYLKLEPGTYFATFVPHGEDGGILLRSATTPFNYTAEVATISTWDPETGTAVLSQTPGAVRLVGVPLLTVAVDIKPGHSPNYLDLKRSKMLPVAILTTATFDATTVDPAMVLFGATGVEASPTRYVRRDVDGDGKVDTLLFFNTKDTSLTCSDDSATVSGETFDGQAFEGTDTVQVVRCK
jgi:hypothetical protein